MNMIKYIIIILWLFMMFSPVIRIRTRRLPKGSNGMAIAPFVLVHPDALEYVEDHEMVHIRQQRKIGVIPFYIIYLYYNIKYGYWNNPYEIEARKLTNEPYWAKKRRSGQTTVENKSNN